MLYGMLHVDSGVKPFRVCLISELPTQAVARTYLSCTMPSIRFFSSFSSFSRTSASCTVSTSASSFQSRRPRDRRVRLAMRCILMNNGRHAPVKVLRW